MIPSGRIHRLHAKPEVLMPNKRKYRHRVRHKMVHVSFDEPNSGNKISYL